MDMTFRALERWPGELTRSRKASPFRANYSDTIDVLDRELHALRARQIVIQLALPPDQIRRDGLPYQNARPHHPGVILSFESPKGSLSFPCDTFPTWQDNLRAIALALEALRKVDRYGVTRSNEQYRGWSRIAGPAPAFASKEDAAQFILIESKHEPATPVDIAAVVRDTEFRKSVYRAAAARLHPDRNNGDDKPFRRLQNAVAMLGGV